MYDAETSLMDSYLERQNAFAPLATMADAHREWHINAGVPMGTPGCPQDACHIEDEYDFEPPAPMVSCGCGCGLRVPVDVVRSHHGLMPKVTLADLRP